MLLLRCTDTLREAAGFPARGNVLRFMNCVN
jgi:hypothetical protein